MGFTVDIRTFKGKQVFCQDKKCAYSKNGFNVQVQAGVDVAIAVKAMSLAAKNKLSSLTLLAGDSDFRELCYELKTEMNK